MYTITRLLSFRALLLQQLPVVGVALIIAELFYKFHSFTLECLAFLATYYVLDAIVQVVLNLVRGRSIDQTP